MRNATRNIVILISTLFTIILFFWLIKYFAGGEGTMNEPPRVVCKKNRSTGQEECFITAHIHAELHIFKEGREVPLGYEKGNLNRNHTHAQKNINHWHGLIKIDPKDRNKKFTFEDLPNYEDFKVKYIPKDFELKIKGKPKFVVNNRKVSSSHKWKVKDKIEINYE